MTLTPNSALKAWIHMHGPAQYDGSSDMSIIIPFAFARSLNPVPFISVRHGVNNDDMEEEDVMVKNGRDH